MNSETRYNRFRQKLNNTFNEDLGTPASDTFRDITPEDRQRAEDYIDELIEESRRNLGELSAEQD